MWEGCCDFFFFFFFQMAPQISYDPAETAHPIKDDSLTFRLSASACARLMVCACECVACACFTTDEWACVRSMHACVCVACVNSSVCVYAGGAHAGFYAGASPAIDLRRVSKQCS